MIDANGDCPWTQNCKSQYRLNFTPHIAHHTNLSRFRMRTPEPYSGSWGLDKGFIKPSTCFAGLCGLNILQGLYVSQSAASSSAMWPHNILGHSSNPLSAGIRSCKHEQGQYNKGCSPCSCWECNCNPSANSTQHHPNLMKHIDPNSSISNR
jgi:hypothetical protein